MRSRSTWVPLVLASLVICTSAVADDGLALVHKIQAALGGADKIAAVHDFEQQVVRALPLFRWSPRQLDRVEEILLTNAAFPQTFVRAWALDSLATIAE